MDELFPYQKEGAQWLTTKRFALLADEPGLGKSAQAIVAADRIGAQRIVVLCPASVRINWTREFAKWSKLNRSLRAVLGAGKDVDIARGLNGSVTVCSYDLTLRTSSSIHFPDSIDTLILDESHYLKSIDAKRAHAVLATGGLVHRAARTWALSGTPAPNHSGELYPLLRTFGATPFKYDGFVDRYCTTRHTPFGPQITGSKNFAELRAILAPIMLRRKKVDVMSQLPAIFYSDLVVEPAVVDEEMFFPDYYLTKQVELLHDKLRQERTAVEAVLNTTGTGRDGLRIMEGMAKSVSTLRRYIGLQKTPAVIDIIKGELESNAYDKLVIFAIHRDVIESLRVGLSKFKPVTLYGGTPADKRQQNIDKFVKDKRCKVFIGNIQAAGTGIDKLQTVCHNAVFLETEWVPGLNAQAVMRLHRIGAMGMPVNVRIVSVADSLDEQIARVLRRKTKDLTEIFD